MNNPDVNEMMRVEENLRLAIFEYMKVYGTKPARNYYIPKQLLSQGSNVLPEDVRKVLEFYAEDGLEDVFGNNHAEFILNKYKPAAPNAGELYMQNHLENIHKDQDMDREYINQRAREALGE